MCMIKTTGLRRIALTVAIVFVVVIACAVLFSCSRDPLVDDGNSQQGLTSSADSLQPSQKSSANAQESSEILPPTSSAGEVGEDEVIVYEHTDATRYRSPVDTTDVTWELLEDNEVRITSEKQEAVYAAEAGEVVVRKSTGWNVPFNYVEIHHGNGITTLYRHLDNFVVEFGDTVEKGQKLAEMQEADGHYSFRFSICLFAQENLEINIPAE